MSAPKRNAIVIYLRLQEGWFDPYENQYPEHCDIGGARLWISPGDQVYYDEIHTASQIDAALWVARPDEPAPDA